MSAMSPPISSPSQPPSLTDTSMLDSTLPRLARDALLTTMITSSSSSTQTLKNMKQLQTSLKSHASNSTNSIAASDKLIKAMCALVATSELEVSDLTSAVVCNIIRLTKPPKLSEVNTVIDENEDDSVNVFGRFLSVVDGVIKGYGRDGNVVIRLLTLVINVCRVTTPSSISLSSPILSTISTTTTGGFTACVNHPSQVLSQLIAICGNAGDPLLQMGGMDILESLAEGSDNGDGSDEVGGYALTAKRIDSAAFLMQERLCGIVVALAGGEEGGEADPFVGTSSLRILKNLCTLSSSLSHPSTTPLCTSFTTTVYTLSSTLSNTDDAQVLALVDCVSSLAVSRVEGAGIGALVTERNCVEGSGLVWNWVNMRNRSIKVKASILFSLATVFRIHNRDLTPLTTSLCESLFTKLAPLNGSYSSPSSVMLFTHMRSTVVEIRLAALTLAAVICRKQWGVTKLLSEASGCYEWLLEGGLREPVKEAKEAKFALLRNVLETCGVGVLDDKVVLNLRQVEMVGAFGTPFGASVGSVVMTE